MATRSFFSSITGQRLALRLRNTVIRVSMQACCNDKPVRSGEYEAGRAAGIAMAIATIEQHYPQAEPEEGE